MRIRLYIVTYKRNDVLNDNLSSLWKTISKSLDIAVTVLANHSDVVINAENDRPNLRVVINTVRMPFAWGNLSKDWNYGILDGFKNWKNPDNVDWVILGQNDVQWKSGWVEKLEELKNFAFITQPRGDQVVALRIEAVKQVGFFDERFTTLHFQELDYFSRAMLTLKEKASINDDHDGDASSWNITGSFMIVPTYLGGTEEENLHTMRFHDQLAGFMILKWKLNEHLETLDLKLRLKRANYYLKNFPKEINWYPFFWDGIPELPQSLKWYTNLPIRRLKFMEKLKFRIKAIIGYKQ